MNFFYFLDIQLINFFSSVMTYLKPKTKYWMTGSTLNSLAFIKMNGPPVKTVDINKYTKEYLERPGNRLCDPPISQSRAKGKADDAPTSPSSSSKYYSSLFNV